RGTIEANVLGGGLTIDPNDTVGVTNSGVLQASNGGILQLLNGPFINTLGTIRALNSSTVEVFGVAIVGGTLTNTATGEIQANGNSTLDGVNQRGQFEVLDNVTVTLANTISNSGTILLSGAANTSFLRPVNGTVLAGGGTITLGGTGNNVI